MIGGTGDDTFLFEPAGELSGNIDGGTQATEQGDSLVIHGDGTIGVTYRPDAVDSTSGTVLFDDGRAIAFRGMDLWRR